MAVSKVTRSFPCTVEQLWQIVTDLTHTDWRSDLARVEVLDETRFVEHTKSGHVALLRKILDTIVHFQKIQIFRPQNRLLNKRQA